MKIKSIHILNVLVSSITAIGVVSFYSQSEQVCDRTASNQIFARTELFFGLNKPNGSQVSEAEFQRFLTYQVTPRFPTGLTLLSGSGQFKNSDNIIEREPSKLLILLYPIQETDDSTQKLQEIRRAYQARFQQESVLQAQEISCVSF